MTIVEAFRQLRPDLNPADYVFRRQAGDGRKETVGGEVSLGSTPVAALPKRSDPPHDVRPAFLLHARGGTPFILPW